MLDLDAMSSYILVVALVTLLAAILVWQLQRSQKMALGWLAAALLGVLLGAAGSYAAVRLSGYAIMKSLPAPVGMDREGAAARTAGGGGEARPSGGAAGSMGGKMAGMGGGSPGKGGGMPGMGGMGGPPAPRPKRDLTALVRKLELLTGDIGITLSPAQAAAIADCLKDVEKAESMSDDEAKARHEKLLSLLDDGQKSRVAAIELPRPPRAGGPGGAGPGGPGGRGGPGQDPSANPFQQETDAKALSGLRQRLAPKSEAEKAPPKKP